MSEKTFRVVIVGASVTGLALANMLEALGIDFIVLEGHKEIAPPIGASIALMGPFSRILDQLGCWEAVKEVWNRPTEVMCMLGPDGKQWMTNPGNMEQMERRHGYPMMFIARRDLLRILYRNLKSQDKIHTEMRVAEIVQATDGVLVKTTKGETVAGDILIGADGVHSTIRREMWRLAAKLQPGAFPEDELSRAACRRMIMFGITKPMPEVTPFINFAANHGRTYLSALGTDGVVYWFCFEDIKGEHNASNAPRFAKEDEKAVVDRFGDDNVTGKWTLRELYESSTITGMTATIEHIYERWHFQRILTVGDSSHSQNPIGGYGGMSCVESAAMFVNALKDELDKTGTYYTAGCLTDDVIQNIFAGLRGRRVNRVKGRVESSRKMGELLALKGLITPYILPVVVPTLGQQGQISTFSVTWVGGVRLKHLPVPKRSRAIPYTDELPEGPIKDKAQKILAKLLASAALLVSFCAANRAIHFEHLAPYDSFAGRRPVLDTFTGIEGVDGIVRSLSSFFSYSVVYPDEDPFPRLQLIYLLTILLPVCSIWTIEASRKSNRLSPITIPVIFTAAAQLMTLGKVGHLYYLLSIFTAPGTNRVIDRHVPVPVSRAVLPALCIGYILPMILMFVPFRDDVLWERMVIFWQPSPVLFAVLTMLFSAGLRYVEERKTRIRAALDGKSDHQIIVKRAADLYNKREVDSLKTTYAFVFFASALVHVTTVVYSWLATGRSIGTTIASLLGLDASMPSIFAGRWGTPDPAEGALIFFKFDMLFSAAPLLIFLLYTVWDIRKWGYISTSDAQKVAVAVLAGQVLVGPAATYAGLWYWRESVIADLCD